MDDDGTRKMLDAATAGDECAMNVLVDECMPRLHAYVRIHMGLELRAREGSLDIVQSVCREVLESVDSSFEFRGRAPFLSWLFTVTLNKLRKRHRDIHRDKRDVDRERGDGVSDVDAAGYVSLTPSRAVIAREDLERLEQAFDQLPTDYREVITLSRIIGMSQAQIAERMGRSEAAVCKLLGRALTQLARANACRAD